MSVKHFDFPRAILALVAVLAVASSALPASLTNASVKLDNGFGTGGKVVTNLFSDENTGDDVAIQADGKIIVVGKARQMGFDDFAVSRYLSNGQLDPDFALDGTIFTDFSSNYDEANRVLLLPNGRIFVGGETYDGASSDFAFARYRSNGILDTTPSFPGKAVMDVGGNADLMDLEIDPTDGSMIAAGTVETGLGMADMVFVKLTASGAPDTDFGVDGILRIEIAEFSEAPASISVLPDGRIIAVGVASDGETYAGFIVQLLADGTFDTSFNATGSSPGIMYFPDHIFTSLALNSNGTIVAGGTMISGLMSAAITFVKKFSADGAEITSFGDGPPLSFGDTSVPVDMEIQADGKILLTIAALNESSPYKAVLVRLTKSGDLDEGFGDGGAKVLGLVLGLSAPLLYANAMARFPNGSVVIVGSVFNVDEGSNDAFLFRLNGTDLVPLVKPVVSIGGSVPLRAVARYLEMSIPRGSKLSAKVAPASKAVCNVRAGKVRGLKRGKCRLTLKVVDGDLTLSQKQVILRTRRNTG